MSDHAVLNLLNELRKIVLVEHFISFFNRFNKTQAQMLS